MPRTKSYDEDIVLERAMDLFWKKGYYATSVQDLVDHLGINRGSMYKAFGDKRQLFERAVELYRQRNARQMKTFLLSHTSVKEGLRSLFERTCDEQSQDLESKGCFIVNTTTELANIDLEIKEQLKKNQDFYISLLEDYIESGKKTGEILSEVDAKTTALLLFTIFNGMRVLGKVEVDQKALLKGVEGILEKL